MGFYNPPETCQIPNIEELYINLFGYRINGVFLEIGAYDGETCSNTSFLADLGWTGIYVEPVKEYAIACAHRHRQNNVQVIHAAIDDQNQEVKIHIGGVLSSIADHHIQAFKQLDWAKNHHQGQYQTVQMITPNHLASLLSSNDIHRIDLMVIDVEGLEYPIISSWDFSKIHPSVLIVESRDRSPEFGVDIQNESRQMLEILEKNRYSVFWRDACNVIMTRFDHSKLVIF